MNFVTVKNGIITGVHCGDPANFIPTSPYFNCEIIKIPAKNEIETGDEVACYCKDWSKKPYRQLVDEGLKKVPKGWKLYGDNIIPLTTEELIVAGQLECPPEMVVENGTLRNLTAEELIIAGLLECPETMVIENGKLRELSYDEQVIKGVLPCPENAVIENGKLKFLTNEELILAGKVELPKNMKIVDGKVFSMSLDEQFQSGQITQYQYDEYRSSENKAELSRRLEVLNTSENQAQAIIDDEFAATWKAQIASLLSVKKQSGWPLSVDWPEV